MATVYKRNRRKPIPDGATLKTFRGKAVAEWVDGRGDKQRAPLTEDGQAVMIEAKHYTIEYFDHEGQRHRVGTKIADKDEALRAANDLETKADHRRRGYIDARQEKLTNEGRRPLSEALAAFRSKMVAAGRCEQHIDGTCGFITSVSEAAGFDTISAITADGVHAYAEDLGKQRSARTVQACLTALKSFTKWLVKEGKLPTDPLVSVSKPNPKSDRRRERRMLLTDEWHWLRSVTLSDGAQRFKIEADERVLLYATAIQTGLRSSELRSLTRRRMFLDGEQPYITCKASSTKNKQFARQYIQPALADQLRLHAAKKTLGTSVFAMPATEDVASMLRSDLHPARQEWIKAAKNDPEERLRREQSDFLADVNHDGEHLDFHALRHTCGAWLAMTGAHPKAVQAIMRHSSITLTMDTYGHLFPGQEAETVARLPAMMTDPPEALAATGTDDEAAEGWAQNGAHLKGNSGREEARGDQKEKASVDSGPGCNTLPLSVLGEEGQDVASLDESRPGRIRTSNQQIMSLLL